MSESTINVVDVAHVVFEAPDLSRMERFLVDFGMKTAVKTKDGLFMRGMGNAPFIHATYVGKKARFVGFALKAEKYSDLEEISKRDHSPITKVTDSPGGGFRVRLFDPRGTQVDVVWGQDLVPELPSREEIAANTWNERVSEFQRKGVEKRVNYAKNRSKFTKSGNSEWRYPSKPTPSQVVRLGHVVLNVPDYAIYSNWYKSRFGFLDSDAVMIGDTAAGSFMRANRGETYTDHHTLAMFQAPEDAPELNHCAFEVTGVDDLFLGHFYLNYKLEHPDADFKHAWGVGRHVLGSQVFDYYSDPWGFKLEHWTDGDRFKLSDGSKTVDIKDALATQWGPTIRKSKL